jgi:hypothetical protein
MLLLRFLKADELVLATVGDSDMSREVDYVGYVDYVGCVVIGYVGYVGLQ